MGSAGSKYGIVEDALPTNNPLSLPKLAEQVRAGTTEYLGDSVYALFDGYSVVLYLDNGDGPKNRIFMESQVIEAFLSFIERSKQHNES